MSKKHKKFTQSTGSSLAQVSGMSHEAEYRVIKSDLIKVVILNVVYLAVILTLFYTNRQSHFLDNWFARALHF